MTTTPARRASPVSRLTGALAERALDARQRAQVYWAILNRLEQTDRSALDAAVDHVLESGEVPL